MKYNILLLLLIFIPNLLFAQEKTVEPKSFITQHENTFNGQRIKYQAIAKETFLRNDAGKEVAAFWSISYIKDDVADKKNRPVTFVFNGGPGSASIWLHMGFFGPQVVKVEGDYMQGKSLNQPPVVKNEDFLLDITDIVFVDPIGTGFSRVIGEGKEEDYWGLNEDAASVAEFIRTWVADNNRWMSPKFMAGESFGTTRAAAVTKVLQGGGRAMGMNGIILISQALDYAGSTSAPDNITSYFTYLPSMATTAWFHKKAGQGKTIEAFAQEARKFAYNEYLPALYKGDFLSSAEKSALANRLSYFIGLDTDYILRSNNRVQMNRFKKELLKDEGRAIGTLDGRYSGEEADQVADRPTLGDASSYLTTPGYTAAFNDYLANVLQVKMENPYLTSNRRIGGRWKWYYGGEPNYVNTSRDLGESMRTNPELRVMVASGYYDLITPFLDAEYTFSRNGMVLDRVKFTYYQGGHMMYNNEPDFNQLAKDIRAVILER